MINSMRGVQEVQNVVCGVTNVLRLQYRREASTICDAGILLKAASVVTCMI